ncbi:MAG: helix-turn-helix transcriptional regulator [Clostridia bacterium]|nr:helix-turn-helix transcriptional regulator [Clostridia bacterium]
MSSVSKSDIDKNFGKILREFRVKNKLTQEQLSEKLGISLKYISRIENGNNGVKTQTLINYMNILGINPNTIYASLITNEKVAKNVEISEKLCALPDDKKDFIVAIIDLLQNLK